MSTRRGFLDRNAWLAWAMLIALSIGMLVGLFSLIVWLLGRPVELAPVNAPDAASPACQQLTAALPAELPSHEDNGYGGDMGPLRRAALANPAPAGAAAWGGTGGTEGQVVLRCGLPRPAELNPTASVVEINRVSWLTLPGENVDTYLTLDRTVSVELTVRLRVGREPVQTVSDAIRTTLPALPR